MNVQQCYNVNLPGASKAPTVLAHYEGNTASIVEVLCSQSQFSRHFAHHLSEITPSKSGLEIPDSYQTPCSLAYRGDCIP